MLNRREHRIMNFLRRQAIDVEPVKSARLSAAVVIKNSVISLGNNSYRTHPFQAKYGKNPEAICLHAEVKAIRNALNHVEADDLRKATMMVYRVKKASGSFKAEWVDGLAKPCSGCMGAIVEFGFKKVVFSTNENERYEVLARVSNY
jgi:tRNA(Arg) A34 adenosine deaminase TadA